jgi:hypothetical protein
MQITASTHVGADKRRARGGATGVVEGGGVAIEPRYPIARVTQRCGMPSRTAAEIEHVRTRRELPSKERHLALDDRWVDATEKGCEPLARVNVRHRRRTA